MTLKYTPEVLPNTYWGDEPENYQVVVLPIPLELTTSFIKGTRNGPRAIIKASHEIELYDIELKKDLSKIAIKTESAPFLKFNAYEKIFKSIYQKTKSLIEAKKFIVALGGEHSITYGLIRAFAEKFKDLSILQFDAHLDLRDKYEDTKYSHASVMRRSYPLVKKIVSVGIRDMSLDERDFVKKNKIKTIHYGDYFDLDKILQDLTKDIYISFDLDAFDPSIMPAVGTPQPGGLHWYPVLNILKSVFQEKNVVGSDVVELTPIKDLVYPNFLAARLVHKLIAYKFFAKKK